MGADVLIIDFLKDSKSFVDRLRFKCHQNLSNMTSNVHFNTPNSNCPKTVKIHVFDPKKIKFCSEKSPIQTSVLEGHSRHAVLSLLALPLKPAEGSRPFRSPENRGVIEKSIIWVWALPRSFEFKANGGGLKVQKRLGWWGLNSQNPEITLACGTLGIKGIGGSPLGRLGTGGCPMDRERMDFESSQSENRKNDRKNWNFSGRKNQKNPIEKMENSIHGMGRRGLLSIHCCSRGIDFDRGSGLVSRC